MRNTIATFGGGTTSSDFVISTNTFTFPEMLTGGGATPDSYSVQILNHPESPYQTCGISNSAGTMPAANITNVSVTCTNVTVQFQAATGNAAEANATIDIPMTISPASARPLNLTLALAAGTAAAGVDFNFLTPTISVPVGATTVNAQIQVFQDSAYEPNETVLINLTGVDKAALGSTVNYTHTINNDDAVTATKVVVTNSGSNFTAGGNTTITVQVQDASSNLATTDSSTQITFTPTGSAKINSVTTGTGDGSYGVAGGAETITVAGGVATVVIANTVAQSFQIAVTNNAALTNPSNISLTSTVGTATQVVITSAAPDTIAGGTSSLTIQIQDTNGNLVTGATTQVTFTPTLGGTVSGVTTGTGDGSYGVAAGAETITVSGGIATITLTNTTAQTYQVAITNSGGLANPANDSVTISPAAASQVVLTAPGSNFITGSSTTLTLQVQDSFGNVRTADSSTQITFSPTNSGRITTVTTGTGDGSYGVAGGAETVTVAAGIATVNIGDAVSETFQVAFTNSGGLTNPANRSLTASNSATQVVTTQAGGSFIAGNSTTLTVQVQTSGGSLVTSDSTTQITFTPTNSGRITGVTTGTGDGSYGVAGAEIVTVAGGIATVTLGDTVVETFQVAITNNAALSNPANDSITATSATGAVVTKAEYFDLNHNGKIDHLKVTFDKNVDEATLPGGAITSLFIAGYSNITRDATACIDESYPTNSNCTDPGESTNTATDNVVWLQFNEGPTYDTGATPDFTGVDVPLQTVAGQGGCFIYTPGGTCATQTSADFGTSAIAEADKAPPVFVATWADPIIDAWQLKMQFSEAVDLSSGVAACAGTVTNAAFTYNNVSGTATSALRTDFADSDGCDSTSGNYYVIPRVNARFTLSDLRTDTISLASTFYDTLGQSTVSTTKTIGYDPNLELYYPMDAASPVSDTNSLVHDVTANARNGAVNNGAKLVKDMTDTNNQAYQFDGVNDTITATGYKGITGTSPRTISMWIDSEATNTVRGVASWGSAGATQQWRIYFDGNNAARLTLNGGDVLTSKMTTGRKWQHLAITLSSTATTAGVDFYVNGILQSASIITAGSVATGNTSDVSFGTDSVFSTYKGKLDEVRLYSRALSAAEVKKLATKVPGGLVAQYPLDDNSGASGPLADLTGNGGSTTNNSAAWTTNRYSTGNAAMNFTGAEYASGSDARLPTGSGDRSVCVWAYLNAMPANGNTQAIFSWGGTGSQQSATLSYYNFSGALRVFFESDSTNHTRHSGYSINQWQHICATISGGTIVNVYADGMPATDQGNVGTINLNTISGSLNIAQSVSANNRLNGRVSDIRVYNRVLTAGEVAALATELDRGLVSYYPLDDAAATAKDYTASGNDLTASGGPTYVADRNGNANGAFNFASASTQYLTNSSAANLPQGSADRTLCAWVKGGSAQQAILSHGGAGTADIANLKLHSAAVPALTNSQTGAGTQSALARAQAGWFHVCGIRYSTGDAILVNGNIEYSGNIGLSSNGTNLRIGANTANGETFDGAIDDARIYNRTLSTAEIRALSGFYPAHASNLAAWFDAGRLGDTSNPNPVNNSDVGSWKDLSLNGNDASKSGSASVKPNWMSNVINGLPTLRWSGTERLDLGNGTFQRNLNTTPHTQLVLFRASGGGAITGRKAGNSMMYRYDTGPVMKTEIGSGATAGTAYVNNTWMIGGFTYANPSGTFYRNGLTDGTFSQVAASATSDWILGDSDSGTNPTFTGDIAEIALYDRVLTAAELEKVNCYYSKKYAVAVSVTCD